MLFADDMVSALMGGGVMTILTAFSGAAVWWFKRKDKNAELQRRLNDQEEETALIRLQSVMNMREEDCNRRIQDLTKRIEELEKRVESGGIARDGLHEKLILALARNKYLESLLRQANVKPEAWGESGDTHPAVSPGGGRT